MHEVVASFWHNNDPAVVEDAARWWSDINHWIIEDRLLMNNLRLWRRVNDYHVRVHS
jgi:hypothetical protein